MRRRNMRFVFTGVLFLVLAIGFFFGMQPLAAKSTDPVEFMRLVGQAAGVVGGVSVALIIAGLIGKKA
jgi:hypothetical protein